MRLRKVLPILILILLSLIIAPVLADGAPQLPVQIYGTATTTSGADLPAGTVITATLGDETFTYTLTEAGKIGEAGSFGEKFLISSTTSSGNIVFSAGGLTANQTVSYVPGNVVQVSLVFDGDIPVTSVRVTGPSSVAVGKTVRLSAVITPGSATNKSVSWRSNDTSVATVSNGVVSGVKEGTATITATAKDGSGKSGNMILSVVAGEEVVEPEVPEYQLETDPSGKAIGVTVENSAITLADTDSSKTTVSIQKEVNDASSVCLTISDATVDASNDSSTIWLSDTSKINAAYPETTVTIPSTVKDKPSGKVTETVNLSLTGLTSVFPIITSNYQEDVASVVKVSSYEPVAMITGTYDTGAAETDKMVSKVSATFSVENGNSWYKKLVSQGKRVIGLHVKDGKISEKKVLTPDTSGSFIMTGTSFSSYVLAVETVTTNSEKKNTNTTKTESTSSSVQEKTSPKEITQVNETKENSVVDVKKEESTTPSTSSTPSTPSTPVTPEKSTTKTPFPIAGILIGFGVVALLANTLKSRRN